MKNIPPNIVNKEIIKDKVKRHFLVKFASVITSWATWLINRK